MNAKKLIKGKYYNFNDVCTGLVEKVIYDRETINHHVFIGSTEEKWICSTTLRTKITEIKAT